MKKIPLSGKEGNYTLVDDEDFKHLSQWKWRAVRRRRTVYVMRKSGGKAIHMHRIIIDANPALQVDHINGNGLDNRKSNLRQVTNRQNQQNLHIPKSSRFPGITFDKSRDAWLARFYIKDKGKYIGRFKSEKEAFLSYFNAIKELGEDTSIIEAYLL